MLLSSVLFVGNGAITNIRYVVYVDPVYYQKLYGTAKIEFCELLNEINQKLADENFIFVGASRWGAMENHGIPTEYRQISNAKALIELSGTSDKTISDPFCGTRFFQSLLESGIYSIITNADKTEDIDTTFFTDSVDRTEEFISVPAKFRNCVRILSAANWYGSRSLNIEMDREIGLVQAYFI